MKNSEISVIMSDNRDISMLDDISYLHYTISINKSYCELHGYNFDFILPTIGNSIIKRLFEYNNSFCFSLNNFILRSVHWTKILSCVNYLRNHENIKYLVFLDSDCVFYNSEIKVESFIKKMLEYEKHLLFFTDLPWNNSRATSGFFVVKNSKEGIEFLSNWWSFKNDFNLRHPYEQSSLYSNEFKCKMKLLNEWQFKLIDEDQFIYHIHNFNGDHNRVIQFCDIALRKNVIFDFNNFVFNPIRYSIFSEIVKLEKTNLLLFNIICLFKLVFSSIGKILKIVLIFIKRKAIKIIY